MSNSWPSRCPSCDQPSFLAGRCGHGAFGSCLGRGGWGLVARRDFFNVLVGGGGGAAGPKKLMGWVGTVSDGRAYPPPTPRFTEVTAIVFYNTSKYCFADIGKS